MISESGQFTLLFEYFSTITISSEIFNPYSFILGIERPDVNLFMSIPEAVTSQREVLIPEYREGLDAVTTILYRTAPLTDLYLYLRDHPLQNPAKAKIHCEHGFGSLRLAVKDYLDVIFYPFLPLISVLIYTIHGSRNVIILLRKFFEGHFSYPGNQ